MSDLPKLGTVSQFIHATLDWEVPGPLPHGASQHGGWIPSSELEGSTPTTSVPFRPDLKLTSHCSS